MTPDVKIMQTYVYHEDKVFFVSMIERNSSAMLAPEVRYHEWIAWPITDPKTLERGRMLYQGSGFKTYCEVIRQLWRTGKYEEEEEG